MLMPRSLAILLTGGALAANSTGKLTEAPVPMTPWRCALVESVIAAG